MASRIERKRASKHLLVAAMGVATVSYVATQSGCAPDADAPEGDPSSVAPYDDEAPSVGVAEQALSGSAGVAAQGPSLQTKPKVVLPPVGNLMPPPPVGNLPPPPVIRPPLPPVGNLMAPPVFELELEGAPEPEAK